MLDLFSPVVTFSHIEFLKHPEDNSIIKNKLQYAIEMLEFVYLYLRLTTGKIEKEYSSHATAMKFIG